MSPVQAIKSDTLTDSILAHTAKVGVIGLVAAIAPHFLFPAVQ